MDTASMMVSLCEVAFIILAVLIMIQIPIRIARSRNVSASNLQSVKLLSWLGLLLGLTWVVALILACVYTSHTEVIERKSLTDAAEITRRAKAREYSGQ